MNRKENPETELEKLHNLEIRGGKMNYSIKDARALQMAKL